MPPGGFDGGVPNQWWRFLLPNILEEGVIDMVIMLILYIWIGTRLVRVRRSAVQGPATTASPRCGH